MPSNQNASRTLFGVSLTSKATTLLQDVENMFGLPVREEWLDPDDQMSGKSKVADDGTPIISINPKHGRRVDVIVHELYHFKLRDQGYPVVQWLIPKEMDSATNWAGLNQLNEQLYDPILHYIFYPTVRDWGTDPGAAFQERTRSMGKSDALKSTFARMDQVAVALYYFKVRLELADRQLFARLLALLEQIGNRDGIQLGDHLAQIVEHANPRTPRDAIQTLVECLNTVYAGKFQFIEHPWTSRRLGRHDQVIARLEMRPVQ